MEIALCFLLLFVWLVAYSKYTFEASAGLVTTYGKIFHIVVAAMSGWGVGDLITKLVFG